MSDVATIQIRKLITHVEEIRHEFGPVPERPVHVGWAAAVIANPFAGGYAPDIEGFMEDLKPLGDEMADRLLKAMGGEAKAIEAYGKGAIVGVDGELEHGALWHVPGGYAMRRLLGEALAIVPSSKKVAATGAGLDVPLGHIDAAYVRSHFSAIEVRVADAPRPSEILYAIAMADGGRIHARVGGLTQSGISKRDGLR
ncbi:amino acid synthesis family protein [Marivibrio halodurans]|uniref:Amino acid synthesis family protein n=1 Tax=Marivibrio halodurans TaxID=2039722 RepID=A0A8J7S0Y0_9PROT|nr:amino acid synthesis family protein [Marivibrio halodurans]MBP5858317.1 amino acid synthesis family protein [Marivibrio halodurans]